MPGPSAPPRKFSRLRHIDQISASHCGPAVLQMLLENVGVSFSQEAITAAAGAIDTIAEYGTRVDQLARAVCVLAPGARLWCKEMASLDDVVYVLDKQKYPVGVEWQGQAGEDDEPSVGEYGHYSIISHVDLARGELIIVDPYKDYSERDRILTVRSFLKRWWDDNAIQDPQTGALHYKKDERLFFVVAPADEPFPADLHMTALTPARRGA